MVRYASGGAEVSKDEEAEMNSDLPRCPSPALGDEDRDVDWLEAGKGGNE
jgi:hypothetical protein